MPMARGMQEQANMYELFMDHPWEDHWGRELVANALRRVGTSFLSCELRGGHSLGQRQKKVLL